MTILVTAPVAQAQGSRRKAAHGSRRTAFGARLDVARHSAEQLRTARYCFSRDATMASSESERSRLRRMPLSTSPTRWAAKAIQAKSSEAASRFSSGAMSRVAHQFRGCRLQVHQVFEQRIQGPEEAIGFVAALGAGAIGLGGAKQGGVVVGLEGGVEQQQRILAGRGVGGEIEGARASDGALREPGDQRPLRRLPFRMQARQVSARFRRRPACTVER